jgi:VWFA-related protein
MRFASAPGAIVQARAMKFIACLVAALLSAQQQPDIRVDVDLVTVACPVTDHAGAPARDLKLQDFSLRDDGQSREIQSFWQEKDLPLTVALVADVSGSQAGFVKNHREALAEFLKQVIGPRDHAMIVEVAKQARLISDLTNSLDDLSTAVREIGTPEGKDAAMLGPSCRNTGFPHSCGGTALWHGLYYTAKALKPVSGRKAIIVLSDGMDTGSDIRLTDVIEMAQSAEAVVYSIKYANPMRFISITATIAQAASRGLERLSRETGGLTFPNPGRKAPEVFAQIESELRNMYVLGFNPPEEARDGKFHKLEVKIAGKDLVVRSRAGYWARSREKQ